jgi:hypothetical protein
LPAQARARLFVQGIERIEVRLRGVVDVGGVDAILAAVADDAQA